MATGIAGFHCLCGVLNVASNTLLTLVDITREAARVLENQTLFASAVNRQYESRFAVDGKKAGDTINIRKPPRYIGRRGEQVSIEASTEQFVPLTLQPLFGCDIQFSTTDLTLSIDEFSDRFVKPQVATVANMIDTYLAQTYYQAVYNQAGTAGTDPNSQASAISTILDAQVLLNNNAAPADGNRQFIVGPSMQAALVGNLVGLFNPGATISRNFKTGAMGDDILGFNFAMDQNVAKHTSGSTIDPTDAGSLSAGVTEGATTLAVQGLAAVGGTLKKGDLIRFSARYGVNPQSRQVWGNAARDRFTVVVTEDVTLSGGAGTVKISPAIRGPASSSATGQFQNVDVLPLANDVITIVSTAATAGIASQNLAFHKDAFVFASVDLELPGGEQEAYRVNEGGIACRMWKGYNINSNAMICRFDVLAGAAAVYPELAVRVVGA
jgi:hypothetical protein